ncbi:MAG: hypothetical protein AB1422_14610 [bacterium]
MNKDVLKEIVIEQQELIKSKEIGVKREVLDKIGGNYSATD